MRYTAMIIGFVLATVTAVGAAEPDRPNSVELRLDDLVKFRTIHGAMFHWVRADTAQTAARIAD